LESTPRIKLGGSINERFDDPIPNLEEVSSRGRHTVRKVDQISNAHGDSDSVDAQRLKAGDIALIEPGFPMSPEPVIDGVRVRLSESAVSSKKKEINLASGAEKLAGHSQLASDACRAVGAIFTTHREPF
jgi:hypothetical protein